jgi:hypothetical protein
MNMKVHQTLVWLNLLSFGTKGLTAPTIGIQSGLSRVEGKGGISLPRLSTWNSLVLNSYFVTNISGGGDLCVTNNTLLRHTSVPSIQLYTDVSAVPSCNHPPPPIPTWPWAFLYWPALLSMAYRPGGQWTDPHVFSQTQRKPAFPPTRAGRGGVAGEPIFAS